MEEKVIDMLVKLCETDEVKNDWNINLFETSLLDSLGFIELLLTIEADFGLTVGPTEVQREQIDTPNKIIKFIKTKKGL